MISYSNNNLLLIAEKQTTMKQTTYKEQVYWNNNKYGKSMRVPLKAIYIIIALVIPVVIPLPLAVLVPKSMVWRY